MSECGWWTTAFGEDVEVRRGEAASIRGANGARAAVPAGYSGDKTR
jgi:hypothetical protein